MIPVVRERGRQADQERKLPAETVEDYKKSGMLRAFVPERFGGKDYDLELLVDMVLEIARGCGASGWLASFYSIHQFMVGWFGERAQEEYWGSASLPLAATVPGYRSKREVVDGGIRLTGRTSFSSGVDYADWVLYHTADETCLIPRADFEIGYRLLHEIVRTRLQPSQDVVPFASRRKNEDRQLRERVPLANEPTHFEMSRTFRMLPSLHLRLAS